MFAIEPADALRPVDRMIDNKLFQAWEPCRLIGIARKDGLPFYIVEIDEDGENYMTLEEVVRRTR